MACLLSLACVWPLAGAGAEVDPTSAEFPPPAPLVTDGTVYALARAGGVTYLGGDFHHVGPRSGAGVELSVASGAWNTSLPEVAGGDVLAVLADGSGGWYLGGSFKSVGGVAATYLAHVLSGGGLDPGFAPAPDGPVRALADGTAGVDAGVLYAGGDFTQMAGTPRAFLAAVDRATGAATGWAPAPSAAVHSIAVAAVAVPVAGTPVTTPLVFAGGDFTQIGSTATSPNNARLGAVWGEGSLNADGTSNAGVLAAAPASSIVAARVSALALRPPEAGTADRVLYAGGDFAPSSGGKYLRAIRFSVNSAGAVSVTAPSWAPNPDAPVRALAIAGEQVVAGGEFAKVNSLDRPFVVALAAVPATGTVPAPAPASWAQAPDGPVRTLANAGSTTYLGGDFTHVGAAPRKRLAVVDTTSGVLHDTWQPTATGGSVRALAAAADAVFAGGSFTSVNPVARDGLAAIDDGGQITAFDPGVGCLPEPCSAKVTALAATANSVYAGGRFTSAGGVPRANLAAFDPTGMVSDFAPEPDDQVLALAADGNAVYAGGAFLHAGGAARARLAALDPLTGTALADWAADADQPVQTLLASCDVLYAGGNFTTLAGMPRGRLAALDAATGAPRAWSPDANSVVYALAAGDGVVYAGGAFSLIGGQVRQHVAALDADTAFATTWNPSADTTVRALAATPDRVFAGGSFASIGDAARSRLAAVGVASGMVTAWDPDADDRVLALQAARGAVFAGGAFRRLGGLAQTGFAAVGEPGADWVPSCPEPPAVPTPTPTATATPQPSPTPKPMPTTTPDPAPSAPAVTEPPDAERTASSDQPVRTPALAIAAVGIDTGRLVMPTRPVVFRAELSVPATLTIVLERQLLERRRRGRCAAGGAYIPARRRCVRYAVAGSLVVAAVAGRNEVSFAGRPQGRTLPPGLYRARFRARAPDGATAQTARTVAFRVIDRRRRAR